MKNSNIKFISMSIFPVRINGHGKKIIHHTSILNYGVINGEHITFETKNGIETKTIQEIESQTGHFNVFSLKDIDLDNLIENKKNKPVEVNYEIETGVLLENRFSPVSFLKQELENKILIKPVF